MITGLRFVLGSTLVLAAGFAPAANSSPDAPATNSATYADERGEDPGSPDITTVELSNDDAGVITFRVGTPSHPTFTEDMRFRIWFSDADPATGLTAGGADAFVLVDPLLLGSGNATLYRCAISTCSPTEYSGRGSPQLLVRERRADRGGVGCSRDP